MMAATIVGFAVVLAVLPFASSQGGSIDPAYAVNITVYHEYQPQYESLGLVDQDTGDLRGGELMIRHLAP